MTVKWITRCKIFCLGCKTSYAMRRTPSKHQNGAAGSQVPLSGAMMRSVEVQACTKRTKRKGLKSKFPHRQQRHVKILECSKLKLGLRKVLKILKQPATLECFFSPWDGDVAVSVEWAWAQGSRSQESRISEPPDRLLLCLFCTWQYAQLMFRAFWSPENPCDLFFLCRRVWNNISFTHVLLAPWCLAPRCARISLRMFLLWHAPRKDKGKKESMLLLVRPRQPRRSCEVSILVGQINATLCPVSAAAGWAWQWRPRCHMGRTCGTACSRQHLRFLSMLSDIQQSSQSRENTCDLGLASATRIGQRFSEVKNMNQAWYFQAVHYLSDWCHPLV